MLSGKSGGLPTIPCHIDREARTKMDILPLAQDLALILQIETCFWEPSSRDRRFREAPELAGQKTNSHCEDHSAKHGQLPLAQGKGSFIDRRFQHAIKSFYGMFDFHPGSIPPFNLHLRLCYHQIQLPQLVKDT
jgi:hypothetical protein